MDDPSPLTKTLYLTGLDCPRKMWYEAYRPTTPDQGARWRMEEGKEVNQVARDRSPEGEFIGGPDRQSALAKTDQALREANRPLFEPAFLHNGMLVRADVLRPVSSGGWILTEVKSTTSIEKEEKQDVAFQKHVLEGSGLDLERVEVMHLNSDYRHPDNGNLFENTDLTGELGKYREEVREKAPPLAGLLQQPDPPEQVLIRECKGCDYQDRCWDLPEQSVFTLPGLHWRNTDTLLEENRVTLDEVEGHGVLKSHHEDYIEAVREENPHVNEEGIREALGDLEYPLHFLDFEAIGKALPWLEGTKPWQQIPFQYSLHVLDRDGRLEHFDYLHDGEGDPRIGVMEGLAEEIEDTGSVIAYHTSFEERCLKTIRDAFPRHEETVQSIIDRLWDQRDIFSDWHYIHPEQKGSTSLKEMLPALTDTGYEDLGVQEGMEAVIAYEEMADPSTSQSRRKELREQLLRYCKRDTKAMVEIHWALRNIAG